MTTKKTTDNILGATHERGDTHTTLTLPNCFADGIIFLLSTHIGVSLLEKACEHVAKRNPKNMIQMVALGLEAAGATNEQAAAMAAILASHALGAVPAERRETVSAEEAYEEFLKKAGLEDVS